MPGFIETIPVFLQINPNCKTKTSTEIRMKKYSIAIEIAIAVGCDRRSINEKRRPPRSTDPGTGPSALHRKSFPRFRIIYRRRLKPISRVRTRAGLRRPRRPTLIAIVSDATDLALRRPTTTDSAGDVPRYSNRIGKACRIRFCNSHPMIPK